MKPAHESDRLRRIAASEAVALARRMLEAMEGRGVLRRGHAERVAELAGGAAERLGLSRREKAAVVTAARLHDIGEVGVPEELLARAGPLNVQEMDVVRGHATVGARLLESLGEPSALIRHHHERPDGHGYPDRLVEADIPVGAALIGVAEAYDAMTHARPYHPTFSPSEARREILRLRGTQFVPRAVDALLDVLPS
jgi:putative nucleotidyltransferase with HDIG domain